MEKQTTSKIPEANPAVVVKELKKTEENLRLSGEEILRMEGEGGAPLKQEQEAQANSCIAASNCLKEARDAIKEQLPKK